MPYKQFQAAQVLTASEAQTYLMNQSVIVFANSAARTSAITAPTEGMVTYLQDVDELEVYIGTGWRRLVVTNDDDGISVYGITSNGSIVAQNADLTSTGTTSTDGVRFGAQNAWARMFSTAGDNFNIRTHTNTPNYNFSFGVRNGSGSDSHVPIYFGTDGITLRGSGTSASTVKVSSSNDLVGVNTSSPASGQYGDWSVDIATGRVRIGGNKAGGSAGISFGSGTPDANWYNGTAFVGLDANTNSASVGFWHSGAWRMQITNGGIITTPYQPCAYATNSNSYTVTSGNRLRFDTVHVNRGGHYNGSNWWFLTPVAGMYFVHCQVLTQYNTSASDLRIARNTVSVDAYSGYSLVGGVLSSHKQGHVQGIVSCGAGDTLSINAVGNIDFYGSPSAGHSSLLIYFLG